MTRVDALVRLDHAQPHVERGELARWFLHSQVRPVRGGPGHMGVVAGPLAQDYPGGFCWTSVNPINCIPPATRPTSGRRRRAVAHPAVALRAALDRAALLCHYCRLDVFRRVRVGPAESRVGPPWQMHPDGMEV